MVFGLRVFIHTDRLTVLWPFPGHRANSYRVEQLVSILLTHWQQKEETTLDCTLVMVSIPHNFWAVPLNYLGVYTCQTLPGTALVIQQLHCSGSFPGYNWGRQMSSHEGWQSPHQLLVGFLYLEVSVAGLVSWKLKGCRMVLKPWCFCLPLWPVPTSWAEAAAEIHHHSRAKHITCVFSGRTKIYLHALVLQH